MGVRGDITLGDITEGRFPDMYASAHAVQCAFSTTQTCECLMGGGGWGWGLKPGSWRNFAMSYFVIALLSPKRIEPLPRSPQLRRSVGCKNYLSTKTRSNVSPGFESELICFPPSSSSSASPVFVLFFTLCFSDWEFSRFFFPLISFTHCRIYAASQLIITTSPRFDKSLTDPCRPHPPIIIIGGVAGESTLTCAGASARLFSCASFSFFCPDLSIRSVWNNSVT